MNEHESQPEKERKSDHPSGARIWFYHRDSGSDEDYRTKEIFVGHHTLFSLLGIVVGGTLVARSLWEYSNVVLGLPLTIGIGILVFAISGFYAGNFYD